MGDLRGGWRVCYRCSTMATAIPNLTNTNETQGNTFKVTIKSYLHIYSHTVAYTPGI